MILLNGKPVNTTVFSDNTSQVWKLEDEDLKPGSKALVTWKFSHEGEFLQLAQLKALLDYHHVRAGLNITYLPYGRQDKSVSNSATFALEPFARLLNSLKFQQVRIRDPHSTIALQLIDNSEAYYPNRKIDSILHDLGFDATHDVVCYPDKGAVTKYGGFDGALQLPCASIHGEKVRDQATGNILSYQLVGKCAGKKVLIVDDICDGGMTFKLLAKDLLAAGATEVHLFVTHGIFSKGVRTLIESGISRVFTADGEVFARHGSTNV